MRANDLTRVDSLAVNPNEWTCTMERVQRAGLPAQLTDAQINSWGELYLKFAFLAVLDVGIIGTTIRRTWDDKGQTQTKIIRQDVFPNLHQMKAGDQVSITVVVEQKDFE